MEEVPDYRRGRVDRTAPEVFARSGANDQPAYRRSVTPLNRGLVISLPSTWPKIGGEGGLADLYLRPGREVA
jgi:hypothetical protein